MMARKKGKITKDKQNQTARRMGDIHESGTEFACGVEWCKTG